VAIFLRRVKQTWPEVSIYINDRIKTVAGELNNIPKGEGAEVLQKVINGDRTKFVWRSML
jgi:hypothetical protein